MRPFDSEDHGSLAFDALVAFVVDALDLYRSEYGEPRIGPDDTYSEWIRHGEEYFIATARLIWQREPLKVLEDRHRLAQLDSMIRLAAVWSADPVLGPQVGQPVGTFAARRTVDLPDVLDAWLLTPLVLTHESFVIPPDALRVVASDVLRSFEASELVHSLLVPLLGYTADNAMDLGGGAIVRRLTNDEIDRCLQMPSLPAIAEAVTSRRISRSNQWCVAMDLQVPKIIGDGDANPPRTYEDDVVRIAERFIAAVRLTVGGSLTRGPRVSTTARSIFHPGRGGSWEFRDVQPPRYARPSHVGTTDAPDVAAVHEALGAVRVTKDRALELAISRFVDARLRHTEVDALVDLVIAAEALFADKGAASGEITFKLSLRAALFCDVPGSSRSSVRRFVAGAYGARSTVVHGGNLKKPKNLRGEMTTLTEMIDDLEHILRIAIRRAVLEDPNHSRYGKWNTLLDEDLDNLDLDRL